MYALVDSNNFYVSCERVFNPRLWNQPVVVLSNNDGCVISRSDEAKKLGIPMGAPLYQYQKFIEEHQIHVFSSNYALYGDMSNRVMTLLKKHSPEVEVYSIDESFMRFTGFENYDLTAYCQNIRREILQCTLIPSCIGIAPTKALAKVANRIAKKFPELQGVYCIDTEEKRIKALKWLAIEDVWGIGRQMTKRLKAKGIHKAAQFVELPDAYIRKEFSVVGLRLKKELQGFSVLELDEVQAKKNIATTRSFDTTYTDFNYIKERIVTFAVTCAEKLRKQQSTCQLVTVFIYTNRFDVGKEQYFRSINVSLPFPTNSDIELSKFAQQALDLIFKPGYAYKKAGVIVGALAPEAEKQYNLFHNEPEKHLELMQTLDRLNQKYGTKKLKLASQALDKTWKMRQEHLSPNYTTNIHEILVIQ